MSDQKVNPKIKKKIDNLFDDDETTQPIENKEDKKEALSPVTPDTKSKAAKFLEDNIDEDKKIEKKIDSTPIKDRIKKLFVECIESAKIKDKEGIIATYIDDLYNPEKTKLDDGNLLLNLLTLSRLQELNIIDFYFDETMKKYSSSEYHLDLEWYKKIMEQPVEEQAKHVHILEMKNVWKFLDDENSTDLDIEEYLVQFIQEKTIDGAIIMVTPDLVPYFKIEDKNEEEYAEKPYIKLVGKWNNRFLYEIDTNQIQYLKGFKRGAFFIKEGNRYVINPDKPLVYYNTIENPFVSKPILKLFASFDFNFYTSASTFLRVEDM